MEKGYMVNYCTEVERAVFDILYSWGCEVEDDISGLGNGWWVTFLDRERYDIYLLTSRELWVGSQRVLNQLQSSIRQMVVIGGAIPIELRKEIAQEYPQHIVLDVCNLLYMARENEMLRSQLVSVLNFTVDSLPLVEPDGRLFQREAAAVAQPVSDEQLLRCWKPKEEKSGDYEKLCCRVLKTLFADDLALWVEQCRSNADLFRFDLLCRIKKGNDKDFWEVAEHHFRSKYIVFEFKNYSGLVTQDEIYRTSKYLYVKALRSVAILISANGADDHADKAIRGLLREEGKLILLLCNQDLINMLEMRREGKNPTDYLSDKLDSLLIDLEK